MGGFNERRGPGTGVRGQEYDMQERLLAAGVVGRYLPDALVWHYVPRERCSPEWALARTLPTAAQVGLRLRSAPAWKRAQKLAVCRLKLLVCSTLLSVCGRRLSTRRRFRFQQRLQWNRGVLRGMKPV